MAVRSRSLLSFPLIYIIADAWRTDVFHQCLLESKLPEIQSELIDNGIFLQNLVSVFPSVSLSSHSTLLTGENLNKHLIAGHRWFDRSKKMVRIYLGSDYKKVNADLSPETPTLFEKFPDMTSFAINSVINRGATRSIRYLNVNSKSILSKTAELICANPTSVFVIWLPKGDIVSHKKNPISDALVKEMISASEGIGILTKRLKQAGLFQKSRIVFISDHGQKATKHSYNLAHYFRSLGYRSFLNPGKPIDCDILVFSNGDACAYLYFDPGFTVNHKTDLLYKLREKEEVDLVFFRADAGNHYIFSNQGVTQINKISDTNVKYQLLENTDPLGILSGSSEIIINPEEFSTVNLEWNYPDIIYQYLTSGVSTRSPDAFVTSSGDYHFGKTPRIGWNFGYHKGSHGGPTQEEMLVSAIFTGQFPSDLNAVKRTKDVLPSILN